MRYSKTEVGPYNIHTIKTDKFKTITIKINFKRKVTKEELTYRSLLSDILVESSNKYPSQRYLTMAMEDLYSQKVSTSVTISGKYSILSFNSQFLNEEYTEPGMLEKSLLFLIGLILNPDLENNQFKEEKLDNVKNKLIDSIKESFTNPRNYAYRKMLEAMDNKAIYAYHPSGYIEDIDSITVESLTEYYKQVIHSDIIDIFIVGNVDNQEIKKIFMDHFLINTIKKQGESHIINHDKYRKRAKKVKEPYDSKQSQLLIGCKLDNLTDFERNYVSFVYSFILGGGPDSRLFRTVREKHSLCYNISSSLKALSNLLIIHAGIDKKQGEKAIKLIRKEILNISKGLIEEKELVNAKINYENAINEIVDIPSGIISHYTEKEYFSSDTFKERINNIKKIDKQMIVDFAKKVHIDTIYFLEGGNLDESDTI